MRTRYHWEIIGDSCLWLYSTNLNESAISGKVHKEQSARTYNNINYEATVIDAHGATLIAKVFFSLRQAKQFVAKEVAKCNQYISQIKDHPSEETKLY